MILCYSNRKWTKIESDLKTWGLKLQAQIREARAQQARLPQVSQQSIEEPPGSVSSLGFPLALYVLGNTSWH